MNEYLLGLASNERELSYSLEASQRTRMEALLSCSMRGIYPRTYVLIGHSCRLNELLPTCSLAGKLKITRQPNSLRKRGRVSNVNDCLC